MRWESNPSGEVNNLHHYCIDAVNLSFLFVCAAYFGLEAGQSILDSWKNEEEGHRYPALLPEEPKQKVYPCKTEEHSKPVVFLVGNLMSLDARHIHTRTGMGTILCGRATSRWLTSVQPAHLTTLLAATCLSISGSSSLTHGRPAPNLGVSTV